MWDMFSNSLRLFLKGKLFREPRPCFANGLIGFAVTGRHRAAGQGGRAPRGSRWQWRSDRLGRLQPFLFKKSQVRLRLA
jgi:hypothetical protein